MPVSQKPPGTSGGGRLTPKKYIYIHLKICLVIFSFYILIEDIPGSIYISINLCFVCIDSLVFGCLHVSFALFLFVPFCSPHVLAIVE